MSPGTRQRDILGSALPGSRAALTAARRRELLAEFLRSRRDRLDPKAVGLPGGVRRRAPGLRREEVAQLAGVSAAWYTWLEQGRDINPSTEVIDAIASALRLTADERAHAYALAGRPLPEAPPLPPVSSVSPEQQAILDALAMPAYVADRAWNVLAWNALADRVFGYAAREHRNTLLIVFGDPAMKRVLVDWDDEAAQLAAALRLAADRAPDDPLFTMLLAQLNLFPAFRALWRRHEVKRRTIAHKRLAHPALGALGFTSQAFTTPQELRMVVFVPSDETTRRALAGSSPSSARARRARRARRS